MQVFLQASTNSAVSVDKKLLSPDICDFIIIDSGVLIHSLYGTTAQAKPLIHVSTRYFVQEFGTTEIDQQQ